MIHRFSAKVLASGLFVIVIALCVGCSKRAKPAVSVQPYEAFGPQAMAYELIGYEWWQWQDHGGGRHETYNVHVVVYRNTDLETIRSQYPVNRTQRADYRYLGYEAALEYLDAQISENAIPTLTERLRRTRRELVAILGRPETGDGTKPSPSGDGRPTSQ